MPRPFFALLLITIAALGCRKNAEDHTEGNISSSGSPAAAPTSSDWAIANDIAVRIDRVRIQKPVVVQRAMVTGETKEEEVDKPDLMIWVSVENRTKTKKLDYSGWRIAVRGAPSLTDEHGNTYSAVSHGNMLSTLKGEAPYGGALNPGDSPVSDVLCFQKPIPAATKLTLTLPSLTRDETQGYTFEIPADAWKGSSKAIPVAYKPATSGKIPPAGPPKSDEKFAAVNEWVKVGDARVRVVKVKIDKVPIASRRKEQATVAYSDTPELMVSFEIENQSKTKILPYYRWGATSSAKATARDEHGNNYRLKSRESFSTYVAGGQQYSVTDIRPGDSSLVDLLCFEPPVDAANELLLTLSAIPAEIEGQFRFKIPASAWKK